VPISIAANEELLLHIIDFGGIVRFSEIEALARTHAANLTWAGADTVHIVDEDADLSEISEGQLDAMRTYYRTVHGSIDFFLVRRSGWVCRSPDAWRVVEYWLRERHSRDGQGAEVYLAATLQALGELFLAEELEAVASRTGFVELWRAHHTSGPSQGAS
jgi:hypothetical protein